MTTLQEDIKNKEYWLKRRKNNEAARRSREKRRMNDLLLERRVLHLSEENKHLRSQLLSIKIKYGEIDDIKSTSLIADGFDSYHSAEIQQQSTFNNTNAGNAYEEYGLLPEEQKSPQHFTQRVFTNATGDTSATVLVNDAAVAKKTGMLLPTLHLEGKLSQIMSNIEQPSNIDNLEISSLHSSKDTFPCLQNEFLKEPVVTTPYNVSCVLPLQASSQSSHNKFQTYYSDPLTSQKSLTTASSSKGYNPCNQLWGQIPAAAANTGLSPVMMEVLQDYRKMLETCCTKYAANLQILPSEMLLYQIQNNLSKLHEIKSEKELQFDTNNVTFANLCSSIPKVAPINCTQSFQRLPPIVDREQKILRHRSSDSGFDGNDETDNNKSSSSPLSPPPSPVSLKISRVLTTKRYMREVCTPENENTLEFENYLKEQENSTNKKTFNLDRLAQENNLVPEDVTLSSHAQHKGTTKRGNEFQLPHKLRLKKSSGVHKNQSLFREKDSSATKCKSIKQNINNFNALYERRKSYTTQNGAQTGEKRTRHRRFSVCDHQETSREICNKSRKFNNHQSFQHHSSDLLVTKNSTKKSCIGEVSPIRNLNWMFPSSSLKSDQQNRKVTSPLLSCSVA